MKMTIFTLNEKGLENRDYLDIYAIELDGEKVFQVADGEPEDNTLCRNFSDVFGLETLLTRIYELGKSGEELEIESKEVDDY